MNVEEKTNPPGNDQERRKQAEARRPMMIRRMLVWDMREKVDLEQAFQKQLAQRVQANGKE